VVFIHIFPEILNVLMLDYKFVALNRCWAVIFDFFQDIDFSDTFLLKSPPLAHQILPKELKVNPAENHNQLVDYVVLFPDLRRQKLSKIELDVILIREKVYILHIFILILQDFIFIPRRSL